VKCILIFNLSRLCFLIRLKLDLSDLAKGGDATKEKREKEKAAQAKMRAGWKSSLADSSSGGWGDDDDWGDYGDWGDYDFEDWGDDYGGWGKSKEYINKYTITMDIKVIGEIPRDGFSLFQTALVHTKEDKRTGKLSFNQSEGECQVSQLGGVGAFGTFGDTTKVPFHSYKMVWLNCIRLG
jgi:hypothetical protein